MLIATRRSPLAMAQAEQVAEQLRHVGHPVRLLPLVTTGDTWSATGADTPADRGMFVKELERALLDRSADIAVHSAKDLPTELPMGLAVLAVPPREDARDVLVGVADGPAGLRAGMRIGTGSPRRAAQLRAAYPDVQVVPIRGNVGTRLEHVRDGRLDAVVVAAAGLARLGLTPPDAVTLDVEVSTPAAGQGFLALEGRADDARVAEALSHLADSAAAACLEAERTTLEVLGGGCMAPVGAYARCDGDTLTLTAFMADDGDGTNPRRAQVSGDMSSPHSLAHDAAAALGVHA